jgi:hypothetical protein
MRRTLRPVRSAGVAAALALSCAACATIDVVPADRLNDQRFTGNGRPIAHIRASTWGWYLFKFVPIWTGNTWGGRATRRCAAGSPTM